MDHWIIWRYLHSITCLNLWKSLNDLIHNLSILIIISIIFIQSIFIFDFRDVSELIKKGKMQYIS